MNEGIGTLRERSLHAALKAWYAQTGDQWEAPCDGYVIDLIRGDLLIEIQTSGLTALKDKLHALTAAQRHIRLVYPIAQEKWIVRQTADGQAILGRRKSPKRGRVEEVFRELVHIPHLLADPHFSLEILLIREEEVRRHDGRESRRRRRWSLCDRHLLAVVERRVFASPIDCANLLPATLTQPFTNRELAEALRLSRYLAQKMTYCLCRMGTLCIAGKRGRERLYSR